MKESSPKQSAHPAPTPEDAKAKSASEPTSLFQVANNSPRVRQLQKLQALADRHVLKQAEPTSKSSESTSALPPPLQQNLESLSGESLQDVTVQRNSPEPAKVQAQAFAQGNQIHLAPGQDQHLPHEAWHVVQQKQGRVQPTTQVEGLAVNDEPGLEKEADTMGQQTMQRNTSGRWPTLAPLQKATKNRPFAPIQRVINPLNPGEYKRGTFFSSAMQKAMALVPLYNALPENDYQSRHIRLGQISAHVNDWITRYTADNPSEQVQTYLDNADQFLVQVQQERASIQRPYDAIVAVRASNMPMQEQNRAVALIRQPDMTQQGYFGTCGLVGIMRGTLLADPRKFVQWAITTMGDAGTLVQSRQRWDTNRNLLGQHEISDENDAAKLDFYMAQWMIKDKLETPAQQGGQGSPEAHLLNQQQRFSPLIAAEANINDWENEGHYALTGEGLAQIAERLLNQGQAGYVPIGNGTFLAAWQQASQGGRAVIASTIGAFHQATQSLTKQDGTNEDTTAGFLENHGEADITNVEITGPRQAHPQEPRTNNNALDSADPAQRTIAFDHWVMIDSVAQAGGGRLRLVIWSWGNKKTYLIRTADINTYFHSLVWVAP